MGSAPPSSLHPGGVNVGFADGSVRFIKNTVAPNTWWALGSRNLGEVISADQY
jgi:prepilin-type processing-associated H-X9-DG protein